jgi:chromosome partitioning protein
MDQVGTFRRIADVLRSAQRAAIEVENAPDKRKRLRTFSAQEVAGLLGVPHKALRLAAAQIAAERPAAPPPRRRGAAPARR